MQLRDYQKEAIEKIESTFQKRDNQLIQIPTGGGKTIVFMEYLKRNAKSGLIICPSIELQDQIVNSAHRLGMNIHAKKSGNPWESASYYVVTAASLNHKSVSSFISKIQFDSIVIDEAHRSRANTYHTFIDSIKYRYKLLGCTATPERMDGKSLLEIFGEMSFSKTLIDLVEEGYLCDMESYRIETRTKALCKGKDFSKVELRSLDLDSRNALIIKTFLENCATKKTLIFCLGIEHAIKVAAEIKNQGIHCEAIYGNLSENERRNILKRFKNGETQVLTNVQILTEGFDEPSIEALIISRPTKSKSLYCQMIGRGLRCYPGKDVCYLYELTDNCHNICTFNVVAGNETPGNFIYKNGTRLSRYYQENPGLSLADVVLKKSKFSLFKDTPFENTPKKNLTPLKGNKINILHSIFYKIPATTHQIAWLKDNNILFNEDMNFLEAAFLIWKQKFGAQYGISFSSG